MPWHLVTRKSRTCVVREGETDPIPGGCHATPAQAQRHLAALCASEPGARVAYSADQPRDDHGRFGEGSGTSTSVSADRPISMQEKLRQIESRREGGSQLMAPSQAHSDAELRIEKVVGESGGANLDGVNPDNLEAITHTVERCAEDYPGSTEGLYVTTGDLGNLAQGDHEFATPFAAVSGATLTLDKDWFGGDPQLLRAAANEGAYHRTAGDELMSGMTAFHPASTGTPEGIVWHELGHVLDKGGVLSSSDPLWGNSALMDIAVSGYAAENHKEAFAEAFAAYNTGGRLPGDVVDALANAGATVKAAAVAEDPSTCAGYVQPWMVKAAKAKLRGGSTTASVVSSIVVGMADGCSVVTREGVSWEVHELGCDHFADGHRTTEELTDGDGARIARIDTTPMAEVFAAPEYAPAEWYAEADPDVWIAAWREEHGIDPHGDIKRLTITEDGRVGARFYDAGQCILNGGPGACPKPSPTRYAAFHQQDAVLDDGNMIVVGAIGNTGGHASRFARLEDAQAKYNDPRIQMLKGRAYDDEKGGYFVGSVVPAEQRRAAGVEPLTHGTIAFLRSCAMSGTWYPTADYGFSPEWWKAHGITAAQVAAVQGYDSIGPQLVTRPALPLVRAVRYAGVEEDRPIIVGGFGGVPDIEDEASYSAEDDCTDCEEDDVVDQATQERIERLEGLVEAQQSVLDQQSAARAAAIEAELTGVPEVEIPPPDGFDERTIHLPTQDLVWIAAAATKDPTQQERRKMAKSGVAMPDGSFYIRHLGDLADAKSSVGRAPANKRNDVIKHINKRAKALGGKPVGG